MRTLGFLVETTCWATVACAVWLVTLSGVTLPELCFAIAASIPCGILAWMSRRALGASWRISPRWVLWMLPVAAAAVAELVALLRMSLTGPRPGHLTQYPLPREGGDRAAGREALATLALCSAPGTVVADFDEAQNRLTVHALVSAGPHLEEVVRR